MPRRLLIKPKYKTFQTPLSNSFPRILNSVESNCRHSLRHLRHSPPGIASACILAGSTTCPAMTAPALGERRKA